MQEEHYDNGSLWRRYIHAASDDEMILKRQVLAIEAINNKHVVKFMQKTIPRNAKCPCGSGRKYKKCCIYKAE